MRQKFWAEAQRAKIEAEFRVARELQFLVHTSERSLRAIALQYRFFTEAFADDLGVVVSRLPPGQLKSLIGSILNEELGEGDPELAHLRLYDGFLESIRALTPDQSRAQRAALVHPELKELLSRLQNAVRNESVEFIVGLRGIGAECVCGVYFSVMNDFLRAHPYAHEHGDAIDWRFWDIHAGDQDAEHDRMMREAIDSFIGDDEPRIERLAAGYRLGVDSWAEFWRVVYRDHVRQVEDVSSEESRVAGRTRESLRGVIRTQTPASFTTRNISRTGALLRTTAPVQLGDSLRLTIEGDSSVTCLARVVRVDGGDQVAVRIIDVLDNVGSWEAWTRTMPAPTPPLGHLSS